MKTAMQELIEIYEYYHSFEEFNEWFMDMGKKAMLEKEKEQICNAYVEGLEGLWISAEEYYIREFNQKGIDAGIFLADLLKKELKELADEDLEPREEDTMVLRLKEDPDPNTIHFRWNDTNEVILKISKEGFYYRGELVSDINNVYERFNEWLTKVE